MIFKDKDGELRIYEGNTPAYFSILFTNADLTFPVNRARPEELLNMDRGKVDTNMSYSLGTDEPITEPMSLSVSARLDDSVNTTYLKQFMSGVTTINSSLMTTTKASTTVYNGDGAPITTAAFADGRKIAYDIEVLWDGTTDLGYRLTEVYFPPDQQTINEGTDAVNLNMNGMVYGGVSIMAGFKPGTAVSAL